MNCATFNGRKILIIGRPCSGKTTLAKKLSRLWGIPSYDLDDINWRKGWDRVNVEEMNQRVQCILSTDEWIISGDYLSGLPQRLSHATDVIILNVNGFTATYRYFKRVLFRTFGQERHIAYGRWYQEIKVTFLIRKIILYKRYAKEFDLNMINLFPEVKIHNY
ncbi:hypothetical protein WH279_13775 [Erwinia sp. MYb375]|uniref:hypothetical protein n=1 Tax=unclassified Erwinia TaxID=2622719 RepID=UPI00309D7C0F